MNEKIVYDVVDIQKLLGLGRTSAYNWIQEVYKTQKPFKVLKVGRTYKIPKYSFDRYINEEFNQKVI